MMRSAALAREESRPTAGETPPQTIAPGAPPVALSPLKLADARKWLGELRARLKAEGLGDFAAALAAREDISGFLGAVFSLSSFLRDLALVRPQLLVAALSKPFDEAFDDAVAQAQAAGREAKGEAELMARLRLARRQAALTCGLADLGGWWDCEKVTASLTVFADACLRAAISFLLRGAHEAGRIELPDPENPGKGSGLIVLAMGKYGAGELNYSSDIDLILFFDPEAPRLKTDDPTSLFSRLARSLVRILQERTGDSYVFRVDLRLRPDPGSTPLAIPVTTALNYYEAYGQNWERAALIKARAAAGDIAAGEAFLKELSPFIWRKYLDYAAIQDVHSIKRQIHAHRGHGEIAVAGHNVKLGRGGIREIEFFAQTQQLIAGGRVPGLREIRTVEALEALEREGWIGEGARTDLTEAYWYLRAVEHRIQMVADEQTHVLPDDREGLKRIALMMGEKDADNFAARLTAVLKRVEKRYAGLFEKAPELTGNPGGRGGNLVFTGDADDPATVATLSALGFGKPSEVIKIVRGWHYGRFPAVRTAQARELLTELTPVLLEAVAATGEADATLFAFDRFLSGLPAGIQLFALLKSNPGLLRLMMRILGAAPRLAEIVTRRPHVFDGLIDLNFAAGGLRGRQPLAARLAEALARTPHYEARLNSARTFAAEQKFLIGAGLINRTLSPVAAGHAFSDLADVLIAAMLETVLDEFARKHGRIAGAELCVVGMGRLGSRELTFGSDLDLILLYDHPPDAEFSDGARPLAPPQYFMRLIQRLIAAMSAPTAEGIVYELDFRLRPSGNAGPLATHIGSFQKYQREEAWTWERQALTRARPLAGAPSLRARAEAAIREALSRRVDPKKLAADVREMRALIDKEKAGSNPFEVKTAKGGLIDIEFIAQWAMLLGGPAQSGSRPTSIAGQLAAIDPDLIEPADRDVLLAALAQFNDVMQLQRLCMREAFNPATSPKGLAQMFCEQFDLPDIRAVEGHLKQTQKAVRAIFNRLLG